MYFSGRLSVDPSQLTHLKKVEPTKAFKKLLYIMTAGIVSDKIEQETFAAISILQQLNNVLRELNISNITRIAHDGIDVYLDKVGKKDDLKEAFDAYNLEIDSKMSSNFNTINLVLEHREGHFKYFIEIDINRTHDVGAYPIQIKLNGLIMDFKATNRNEIEQKLKPIFSDQQKYETYRDDLKAEFEAFMEKIEAKIKETIQVDNIKKSYKRRMIIPKKRYETDDELEDDFNEKSDEPVNHGYYEVNAFMLYSMIWADMAYQNSIFLQDIDLVNSTGEHIGAIGMQGIDASNDSIFSSETPYEDRVQDTSLAEQDGFTDESEQDWFGGNKTEEVSTDSTSTTDTSSDSSWFSFGGDSNDASSSSSSSCSSCAGGCGGGCGGG